MSPFRTFAKRPCLATILIALVVASGMARAWAMASDVPAAPPSIAGIAVHICHADADAGGPSTPASHDCCDLCALCAPVVLPGAPEFCALGRSDRFVLRPAPGHWVAIVSRQRTPRLAQAPPAA